MCCRRLLIEPELHTNEVEQSSFRGGKKISLPESFPLHRLALLLLLMMALLSLEDVKKPPSLARRGRLIGKVRNFMALLRAASFLVTAGGGRVGVR